METTSGNRVTYSQSWTLIPTHYCRNNCGYCVFVERAGPPAALLAPDVAEREIRRARAAGATELLIMSGEGVEQALHIRTALRRYGFSSYLDYLLHVSRVALACELLPHVNVGNLTEDELRALRAVVPSMGMMLETVDESLMRAAAHRHAPDKEPARRLETLRAAGRARVPFTTGLLVGIGESRHERERSLSAIAEIQAAHGHIQEVIIQPFTPHAGTTMSACAPPCFDELLEAVQMARAILPPEVSVQIPPNLMPRFVELVLGGARDLGGISPDGDRINPHERWLAPSVYRAALAPHGFTLHPRLAVHESWATPSWLSAETWRAVASVRQRLQLAETDVPNEAAAKMHERCSVHV